MYIFVKVIRRNPDKKPLYFVGIDEASILAEAITGSINGVKDIISHQVISEVEVARMFEVDILNAAVSSILTGNSTVFALGVAS